MFSEFTYCFLYLVFLFNVNFLCFLCFQKKKKSVLLIFEQKTVFESYNKKGSKLREYLQGAKIKRKSLRWFNDN